MNWLDQLKNKPGKHTRAKDLAFSSKPLRKSGKDPDPSTSHLSKLYTVAAQIPSMAEIINTRLYK